MRKEDCFLLFLLLFMVEFLSSAWKNVGMTMTCNSCDVTNQSQRKSSHPVECFCRFTIADTGCDPKTVQSWNATTTHFDFRVGTDGNEEHDG